MFQNNNSKILTVLLFASAILMAFQNCSDFGSFNGFETSGNFKSSSGRSFIGAGNEIENGVPFEGKIYNRIVKGHTCNGVSVAAESISIVKGQVILTQNLNDNCNIKSKVDIKNLDIPSFSDRVIGYKDGIYVRNDDGIVNYQAWCKVETSTGDLVHVLVKHDAEKDIYNDLQIVERFNTNLNKYESIYEKEDLAGARYIYQSSNEGRPNPRVRFYRNLDPIPEPTSHKFSFEFYLSIHVEDNYENYRTTIVLQNELSENYLQEDLSENQYGQRAFKVGTNNCRLSGAFDKYAREKIQDRYR